MPALITVTSPSDGDVITYPLVIIRGKTTHATASDIFVFGHKHSALSASVAAESMKFPVVNGCFTVHLLLDRGYNPIFFSHTTTRPTHPTSSLFYEPRSLPDPYVHLVYVLASDSDGSFQSPEPLPECSDLAEGKSRLFTAGLMIQSAMAEMMNAEGFGRRTFSLCKSVHVHRLQTLTTAEAHEKTGMQLWNIVSKELDSGTSHNQFIDIAVMSFTRFIDNEPRAHTALGGGKLALFGGGSLFTWPSTTRQIPSTLLDTTPFDTTRYFDDSAGRTAKMGRRACTATTIGALLHELGHCLSLPHPCGLAAANGGGIMARGFDNLDRLFVQPRPEQRLPFWDRGSAVRLRYHKFLQFTGEAHIRYLKDVKSPAHAAQTPSKAATPAPAPAPAPSPSPSPSVPKPKVADNEDNPLPVPQKPYFKMTENGSIECHASAGIGHIGYYRNGDNAAHEEFLLSNPEYFEIPPLPELRNACQAKESDRITLSAIDANGHIMTVDYDKIQ